MKILLVTDTHGHLAQINELSDEHAVDAVIHAGDFGFYDDSSIDRLAVRELRLRIVHSDLSDSEKKDVLSKNVEKQRDFVRAALPLSDLPIFLSGEKRFHCPVYAVWGNHEDVEVVKRFRSGEYHVEGLNVLHEENSFHVDRLHICGLGGNLLVGKKLFQEPIAGGGGKVWSVLGQYFRLLETVESGARDGEKRILVSHVSPGKEAFITLLGLHLAADLVVSGHMGPPFSMIWNDFAIRSAEESVGRVEQRMSEIARAFDALGPKNREGFGDAIQRFSDLPIDTVPCGRGRKVPAWYLNMFNVNLPDAANGYALLEAVGDKWRVHCRSRPEGEQDSEPGVAGDA